MGGYSLDFRLKAPTVSEGLAERVAQKTWDWLAAELKRFRRSDPVFACT